MSFVEGPVRVSVPATSANLGPGFDSLGLALGLRDRVQAQVSGPGMEPGAAGQVRVAVEGEGAGVVPLDDSHLVVRSMYAAFDAMGARPDTLSVHCHNVVPHGRGLGSSSSAIVAGVCLARGLVAGGSLLLDDQALFSLAADLEGHPDNVAPAFFGGFVISGREQDEWYAVRACVDPRVSVVVFIPTEPVETKVARGLLPATVPHCDAAANSGRAALLVAALAGQPEQLLAATRDYLHQDYRESAMPRTLELVRSLREDGVPAIVSGAGPTVLAFTDGPGPGDATYASVEGLLARCPAGWVAHHLEIDRSGALLS
ncbi:homoserine kinase [Nocardioides pacificus]